MSCQVTIEIHNRGDRLSVEKTFPTFDHLHPFLKSEPGEEVECDLRVAIVRCIVIRKNITVNTGTMELFYELEAVGILNAQMFLDAHTLIGFDKITREAAVQVPIAKTPIGKLLFDP